MVEQSNSQQHCQSIRTTVPCWNKPGLDYVAALTVTDSEISDRIDPYERHIYFSQDRDDYRAMLVRMVRRG